MEIIYAADEAGQAEAVRLIREREEGVIVNRTEKTWCVCGAGNAFREEVCRERGVLVFHAHHLGGTTVVFPGDLSVMEVRRGPSRFGAACVEAACRYLRERGLPVGIAGNDLMLWDGEAKAALKVGSHSSSRVGELTESSVHFSVGMDTELVRAVCTKPMVKRPGALGVYGVTAEELWEAVSASLPA